MNLSGLDMLARPSQPPIVVSIGGRLPETVLGTVGAIPAAARLVPINPATILVVVGIVIVGLLVLRRLNEKRPRRRSWNPIVWVLDLL